MNNNINPENLVKGIKNKNVNELISSLSDADKQILDKLLKDKKAREELLSSNEAKMLFNLLNKKDGR
ncbi:MAG: hypothetical protein IJP21_00405 [Clostridia bacterium]|nr:hypothetical protein [Clostridia bacterium]